jgi:hypothetical protein
MRDGGRELGSKRAKYAYEISGTYVCLDALYTHTRMCTHPLHTYTYVYTPYTHIHVCVHTLYTHTRMCTHPSHTNTWKHISFTQEHVEAHTQPNPPQQGGDQGAQQLKSKPETATVLSSKPPVRARGKP